MDVGGYDGMTTLGFIKRCPSYKKVYFFEPESDNYRLAKVNLADKRNIQLINKGCSLKNDTAYLVADKDISVVSSEGDQRIELVALDSVILEDENILIKMDIEGAEYEAILGCMNIIKKCNPTLAVSVYHSVSDFWRIPFLVLSINPNYKLFVRHYTETVYETVMYFVPNEKLLLNS